MLNVSPKPWVNGDSLVASNDPITGDLWSGYALIFEMMAPLRLVNNHNELFQLLLLSNFIISFWKLVILVLNMNGF